MRLFAISDLHLGLPDNQRELGAVAPRPEDWLALVGDLGETEEHLRFAFETLGPRFKGLSWTPGNHELWSTDLRGARLRGEDKYRRLVEIARSYGVQTPEDEFISLDFEGGRQLLCPLFTLYDYSFGPPGLTPQQAVEWALADGAYCSDESRLDPWPYPSVEDWCLARCELSEKRLHAAGSGPKILMDHFPLRAELVWLPRIPRFRIWCGTQRTSSWHKRFQAHLVLSGHLHIPSTRFVDGVRFEEVSLGYPREWLGRSTLDRRLRQVFPRPDDREGVRF